MLSCKVTVKVLSAPTCAVLCEIFLTTYGRRNLRGLDPLRIPNTAALSVAMRRGLKGEADHVGSTVSPPLVSTKPDSQIGPSAFSTGPLVRTNLMTVKKFAGMPLRVVSITCTRSQGPFVSRYVMLCVASGFASVSLSLSEIVSIGISMSMMRLCLCLCLCLYL